MDGEVFRYCRCTGQSFTFDEWAKWLNDHDRNDSSECQLVFGDFEFNIFDVCFTPNTPVNWQNKTCSIEVSTALSPCGQWDYGINIKIYKSMRCFYPQYIDESPKGYPTEKACIYAALNEIRDYAQKELEQVQARVEYDDSGNIVKNCSAVSGIRAAIKHLDKLREYYNPSVQTLFDFLKG